jgi:hypothetical protein
MLRCAIMLPPGAIIERLRTAESPRCSITKYSPVRNPRTFDDGAFQRTQDTALLEFAKNHDVSPRSRREINWRVKSKILEIPRLTFPCGKLS